MKRMTLAAALNETLQDEMVKDPSIIVMGEDIGIHGGIFTVTKGLRDRFGEKRVKDTPISEAAIVGTGLGAALTGLKPIVEIMYIDFTGVCMDQILNQVAKIHYMTGGKAKVPLVIRTQCGAGTGEAAQHSQCWETIFCHVPGLKVVTPSTPYNARGLLRASIADDNPVMFIEHKLIYYREGEVPEEEYIVPLGKADIKRSGSDITVVTYSNMVHEALDAADTLSGKGIDVEVVDLQTLVPMDIGTVLNSVKKTGKLIVVHEAYENFGVGAEVCRQVVEKMFDSLDTPVKVIGAKRAPIPYNIGLEKEIIPGCDDIVEAADELCGNR